MWLVVPMALMLSSGPGPKLKPEEILDRAIRAHGGEKNLLRPHRLKRTGALTLHVNGEKVEAKEQLWVEQPSRLRSEVRLPSGFEIISVMNGKRAWRVSGGAAREIGEPGMEDLRLRLYRHRLESLIPLRDRKRFTLEPLLNGEDREKSYGLRVRSEGRPDVVLYFDQQTGYLKDLSYHNKSGGRVVHYSVRYANHRAKDGVKLPRTIEIRENDKTVESRRGLSYELLKELPRGIFEKP